jgi:hypothetical protein
VGLRAQSLVHQGSRHCGPPRRDPHLLHLRAHQVRRRAAPFARARLRTPLGVHAPSEAHDNEWVHLANLAEAATRVDGAVDILRGRTNRPTRSSDASHVPRPRALHEPGMVVYGTVRRVHALMRRRCVVVLWHGVWRHTLHRRTQRPGTVRRAVIRSLRDHDHSRTLHGAVAVSASYECLPERFPPESASSN